MPSPNDLCTVAELKRWLGAKASDADPLLASLISAASGTIYSYLQRKSLASHRVALTVDGNGHASMLLPEWPVTSIQSLLIGIELVSQSPGFPSSGYLLEPWDGTPPGAMQELRLIGRSFWRGQQNVSVNFTAGYLVQNETQAVPASPGNPSGAFVVAVDAPWGPWSADAGVSYASGAAFTKVTTTPTIAGTYQLDLGNPGQYLFSPADQGTSVLVSYSFVPSTIRQACMEIAAERYVYKSHVGETAVTTQGVRTTSFAREALSPHVEAMLAPYRRVSPL